MKKKLLYSTAAMAVVFAGATGAPAASQDTDEDVRTPHEYDLMSNPVTGHIYCVVLGTGCIVR